MASDSPFQRRVQSSAEHRRYINLLLTRLDDLRDQTDPGRGTYSAKGKDRAAFLALQIAGKLVQAVASWAIEHQLGLAAEGLEFVPGQPLGTEHPEYLKARAAVDDHRHEITGSVIRGVLEPAAARLLVINLVNANPGAFPKPIATMLVSSLKALELGDIQPFLSPRKSSRNIGYDEQQLQLEAIGLVSYRKELGKTKHKALEDVASAFGVSSETIRSWEKRLRTELGPLQVEQTIWLARNAAEIHKHEQQRVPHGEPSEFSAVWEEHYGDLALQEAAERFRSAQRMDTSKS